MQPAQKSENHLNYTLVSLGAWPHRSTKEMNCLIRIENHSNVQIEGYEKMSANDRTFWVFEISYNQKSIADLLQDIQRVLTEQEQGLIELIESGADVFLFLEHEELTPVRIKNETLTLVASIGAHLEVYTPER